MSCRQTLWDVRHQGSKNRLKIGDLSMEPVELQIGSKKLVLLNFIQKSNFFLNLFKFDHFVNLKFENFKNN